MSVSLSRWCAGVAAASALATAQAALSLADTVSLAREQAPALQAQRSALDGAQSAQAAAATLPDPRLIVGVDNLPLSGPDRYALTRDSMTMQRIGLMQEVPNRAKRAAREAGAQARIERERAGLAAARLAVQRDAALAWLGVYYAERRATQLGELERENALLLQTLDARIAGGSALPADRTMADRKSVV